MKILVTGTHFTPAQAVIEELQKNPDTEIVYVGRKHTREGDRSPSAESQVLPKMGVKFIPIITGRLQRSFTVYTIPSLLKIPVGFLQSFYILLTENPDVVLSFGGYVGVPITIVAWLFSIPVIIHEQTLMPGLANKISAIFADKIALTLKENDLSSYQKTVLTGNPIRKELLENGVKAGSEYEKMVTEAKKSNLPIIYITGGNQGSHVINLAVKEILPKLNEAAYVFHQCGDSHFHDWEELERVRATLQYPERYKVAKWIDGVDVGLIFRKCNLVVTRAGMNTLLEAAYFKVPTLIIPLPVHKEQSVNARYFAKLAGAGVLLQKDLNGESLLREIKGMLRTKNDNTAESQQIIIPDAAKRLALETITLAKATL